MISNVQYMGRANEMNDSNIEFCELKNGEYVALAAFEIKSVPHISIFNDGESSTQEIFNNMKLKMEHLVLAIHQIYRQSINMYGNAVDISIELLFITKEAINQPYNADINILCVQRVINYNKEIASNFINQISRTVSASLREMKYDYQMISYSDIKQKISKAKKESISAIIKEERNVNLQNSILPYCLSFDSLKDDSLNYSSFIQMLIKHPDCVVIMDLIPTSYTEDEISSIECITQTLDTLKKGISDRNIGNISFSLTDELADTWHYYAENRYRSLFSYNILVVGNNNAVSDIVTNLSGILSKNTNLNTVFIEKEQVNISNNFFPLPWAINEYIISRCRSIDYNNNDQIEANIRLPFIITAEESTAFFGIPVGTDDVSAGLKINESKKVDRTYFDTIINSGDINVGQLKTSLKDTIGFRLNDLTKHMLICGVSGSGKTTFGINMLEQLWKQYKIPFLVIEPAKNEYRALVNKIPELVVFTPGKSSISPFVFNPFIPPKNVTLESYKPSLKTAFSAGVSMVTPLDKIFEEAIDNCYSDHRWLESYTSDDAGGVFNIQDFIKSFQNTFDEIGYTGDARNIGRAGVVRLKGLLRLFDNYYSIPIEDLLSKPTIIELAAIENSDEKALLISIILISILSYVNNNYLGQGNLKNIIMLEEAHVLFDAVDKSQSETQPNSVAQNLLKRMLAEIRAYGIGLVIADQSPRKVTADVVALTDIKVCFRLVEKSDKQLIADSTNMDDSQVQRLARMRPGEAFLYFGKLNEPEEVLTPDYREKNNIAISISDDDLRDKMKYWNDKMDKLRPYPECQFTPYCQENCELLRRQLGREIARRIFRKNIQHNAKDIECIKQTFSQISKLVIEELNSESFNKELLSCVKVHLWRLIKYDTKLKISNQTVIASLIK